MKHCSTPAERRQWVTPLLVDTRPHGLVSQISRERQVSRKTLYQWKAAAEQAIDQALGAPKEEALHCTPVERAVLTLFVEGHSSYRGIKSCIWEMLGARITLAEVTSIINTAGERAKRLLAQQTPPQACCLALDEQYSHEPGQAYLNVVDAQTSVVWATTSPMAVTAANWDLVLSALAERGVQWHTAVSDGGTAIEAALAAVDATDRHQRDVWHVERQGGRVLQAVRRHLRSLGKQLPVVQRQAERLRRGQKPRGRNPKTDVQAHLAQM